MKHDWTQWGIAMLILLASQSPIWADRPPAPAVPPHMEIEVLDPVADPRGQAAVDLVPGRQSELRINIPETVLVHRYYYSGDRSFQFGLLPGGPTIAVVNHPDTGRRRYIPLNLPPGAPRVRYTADEITYAYGRQRVSIKFPRCGPPEVVYCNGRSMQARAAHWGSATREHASELIERSQAPDMFKAAGRNIGGAFRSIQRGTEDLFGRVFRTWKSTALGDMLSTSPNEAAMLARDRDIRRSEWFSDEEVWDPRL